MYCPDCPLITLEDIQGAQQTITKSPYVIRTPMIHKVQRHVGIDPTVELHFKLESLQTSGSFKSRGVVNQMISLPEGCGTSERKLISMSAGNYGKAFAMMTKELGLKGHLVMPETAPENRRQLIQSYGVEVESVPAPKLSETVDNHVLHDNMVYLHSFDDVKLIAGHASLGMEILEDVPEPDVVLVCCGGGGLVSGVAAAIKLSGHEKCRVYGVEPENSRTMHESFRIGKPATMEVGSVAGGLSPPFAGSNTFRHCRKFVEDILLVSDEQLVAAMFHLYERRILVEPSGAAAFAALLYNKVPDVTNKRVVVVITGGNVSPDELVQLSNKYNHNVN